MSHWQSGKISAKCSFAILQKALINILSREKKSDWIKFIQDPKFASASADKSIFNSHTDERRGGYSIVIPHNRNGGPSDISYGDIGLRQDPKTGAWAFDADVRYLPQNLQDIGGRVTQEVSRMQARAIAARHGFEVKETQVGGQIKLTFVVPVSEANKIKA